MAKSRRMVLLFLILFASSARIAQPHPVCVDGSFALAYDASTSFCAGPQMPWNDGEGRCCTQSQDDAIRGNYTAETFASAPDRAACPDLVKLAACSQCSPFAGHVFFAKFCKDFNDRFRAACGGALARKYDVSAVAPDLPDEEYCAPFNTSRYYQLPPVNMEPAFPLLAGKLPTMMVHAQAVPGVPKIWGISRQGLVLEFGNSSAAADVTVVMNITDRTVYVSDTRLSEPGLVCFAFSPNFTTDGYFYALYMERSDISPVGMASRVSRFQRAAPRTGADGHVSAAAAAEAAAATAASELKLLALQQPAASHNTGWLGFGPIDNFLYIAAADGKFAIPPVTNGQNLSSLLGKVLRIDVRGASASQPYTIPSTNPFGHPPTEVWAYGLRNPWRCSHDAAGRLWCADVGNKGSEEVNIVTKGANYGWQLWEGFVPFTSGSNPAPATRPRYAYCHTADQAADLQCDAAFLGHCIVGGIIYRGSKYRKQLKGHYIFGDHNDRGLGDIYFDKAKGKYIGRTLMPEMGLRPVSFFEGADNEIYIVEYSYIDNSMIYKFRCGTACGESATL